MKTILFTNSRDELRVLEWISHHINIGFDYIYIYDHKSVLPIKSIIKPNKNIIVKNIDEINKKSNLIDRSVDYAKLNNFDWMLYLDMDEFLVLPNDDNIVSFLLKYDNYEQIGINWLMFGSNFHKSEPIGTMIENYTMCSTLLDQHIKSFVRPNKVINTLNAHVYKTLDFSKSIGVDYKPLNEINKHLHKCEILEVKKPNFLLINAFIAHYYTQSYETYYNRKIKYPPDDIACTNRRIFSQEEVDNLFNNLTFTYVCEKYNDLNKKLICKLESK
jgi:hypothetical protein